MNREIEWSSHASDSLRIFGLREYEYEVDEKLQSRSRWRENPGDAKWRAVAKLAEHPYPLMVLFDCPVEGDDLRICVVTVWELR